MCVCMGMGMGMGMGIVCGNLTAPVSHWVCGGLCGSECSVGQPTVRPTDGLGLLCYVPVGCWTFSLPSPLGPALAVSDARDRRKKRR